MLLCQFSCNTSNMGLKYMHGALILMVKLRPHYTIIHYTTLHYIIHSTFIHYIHIQTINFIYTYVEEHIINQLWTCSIISFCTLSSSTSCKSCNCSFGTVKMVWTIYRFLHRNKELHHCVGGSAVLVVLTQIYNCLYHRFSLMSFQVKVPT